MTDAVAVEPVSRSRIGPPPVKALPRFSRARALLARLKNGSRLTLVAVARPFVSADVWNLGLTVAGFGLLVAGVYTLAGLGWSFIAGGLLCVIAASFIRKGIAAKEAERG